MLGPFILSNSYAHPSSMLDSASPLISDDHYFNSEEASVWGVIAFTPCAVILAEPPGCPVHHTDGTAAGRYTDIEEGLAHAWSWRKAHPHGY